MSGTESSGSTTALTLSARPLLEDTVIVVPAYKEAGGIAAVIDEIRAAINPIVLVINRPSNDGTDVRAREHGAIVVDQSGRGKGNAMRQAIEYVRTNLPNARYIGFVDADCTYPASPMGSMRQLLDSQPQLGMVIAARENLKNNGAKSEAFAIGNRLLGGVHHALNHVPLQDPLSGLRMVKTEAIGDWRPRAQGFDIECELNYFVRNVKDLEITEVDVPYRARVGEKKLRLRDGLVILRRMILIALRPPSPHAAPAERPEIGARPTQP
jgi:glycosyltransferase involved in cell wall biosynthesis